MAYAAAAAACSAVRRLAPVPLGGDAKGVDPALGGERLCVGLAGNLDHAVLGHGQPAPLQPFLQPRLRVLAQRVGIGVAQHVVERPLDRRARGLETRIDEHGAEDCFQRVGEDGGAFGAAASQLAFADPDRLADTEPTR